MIVKFYAAGLWASSQDLDREIEHEGVAKAMTVLREAIESAVQDGELAYYADAGSEYQATFRIYRDAEEAGVGIAKRRFVAV